MLYQLWIKDEAKAEIGKLPDHMRAQVRRAIESLRLAPRPYYSMEMTPPSSTQVEVRRLKIEHWRVIYIVDEEWSEVGILAVRDGSPRLKPGASTVFQLTHDHPRVFIMVLVVWPTCTWLYAFQVSLCYCTNTHVITSKRRIFYVDNDSAHNALYSVVKVQLYYTTKYAFLLCRCAYNQRPRPVGRAAIHPHS